MTPRKVSISDSLDAVDVQIAHAIQIAPRASFRQIADVLDVAEQTVARRYRRMRREGLIRVTLALDPRAFGDVFWLVRVRCRPEASAAIADALARRDDVSWISIHSAGWEIVFNLRGSGSTDSEELLMRLLPKASHVLDVSPSIALHVFIGASPDDWGVWRHTLTDAQVDVLTATNIRVESEPPAGVPLSADDQRIAEHLAHDGRTSYSTIARALGTTAGIVTRRVETLLASGVAYFDVDIATAATGMTPHVLWLRIEPRHLDAAGKALAAHPDVPFATAITGRFNLTVTVLAAGTNGLYTFLTTALAAVDGVLECETVPLDRRIKHASAVAVGDRLAPPPVSSRRGGGATTVRRGG